MSARRAEPRSGAGCHHAGGLPTTRRPRPRGGKPVERRRRRVRRPGFRRRGSQRQGGATGSRQVSDLTRTATVAHAATAASLLEGTHRPTRVGTLAASIVRRTEWVSNGASGGSLWVVASLLAASVAAAAIGVDFGVQTEKKLAHKSQQLFGVRSAFRSSSSADLTAAQALADPAKLVTLSRGLRASVVASGPDDNVGPNSDQMVLWPRSHPAYLIAVNEEGSSDPGLQKINLRTGQATTIATGIEDNDPVRRRRGERSSSARKPGTARCTRSSTR